MIGSPIGVFFSDRELGRGEGWRLVDVGQANGDDARRVADGRRGAPRKVERVGT